MASGSLLSRTIDLLNARPRAMTYEQIERDNPSLHYRWLSDLVNGKIANPSVNKIQCLYEYLTGKPLELI